MGMHAGALFSSGNRALFYIFLGQISAVFRGGLPLPPVAASLYIRTKQCQLGDYDLFPSRIAV